jgi:hypothetical protein
MRPALATSDEFSDWPDEIKSLWFSVGLSCSCSTIFFCGDVVKQRAGEKAVVGFEQH